jgi:hypothetical protein
LKDGKVLFKRISNVKGHTIYIKENNTYNTSERWRAVDVKEKKPTFTNYAIILVEKKKKMLSFSYFL